MTKNQFRAYAKMRGCEANYSGHLRRFFLKKVGNMDINKCINSK